MSNHFTNDLSDPDKAIFSDGVLTTAINFAYAQVFDECDRGNPVAGVVNEDDPHHFELAGEAVAKIMRWIWSGQRKGKSRISSATKKLVTLTVILNPAILDSATLADMARELGCTKAALSKLSIQFREQFGHIQFRNTRSDSCRERMRQARFKQIAAGEPSPCKKRKKKTKRTKSKLP